MDKKIKFSFWNYAPLGMVDNLTAVKDWVEAESNLPMSFIYDYQKNNKEEMINLLDECARNGLKLIISDTRTLFRNLKSMGKENYKKLVKAAFDDFGHHPAAFGFFIGDEPSIEETDIFIEASQIVLEEMPGLTPFGNLLPYFASGDFVYDISNKNIDYYADILNKILSKSKLPLIGYDQYSQCGDDFTDIEAGINSYFLGLNKYQEITKKYEVPFYVSLLSVGHWMYRVPTEDDIRWQISTAFAHGARGILWFYFYQNDYDNSYRLSPFRNCDLKKTPMFDIVARQQFLFKSQFEDILNKVEFEKVFYLGDTYDPSKRFVYDEYIKDIKLDRKLPVVISYYSENKTSDKWVSFVNGSQRYSNLFRISFADGRNEVFWLSPGEMKMYKIKKA